MIKTGELDLNSEDLEDISPQCKDLITKLLDKNPQTRLSVQDSFDHAWFKSMKSASAKKMNSTLQIKREGDNTIIKNIKNSVITFPFNLQSRVHFLGTG
jgi:serine/threonine protein kinase